MGNRLKEMRVRSRMTQSELSKKANVSRPTIIKIENGSLAGVKTATLVKIADALETKVADIFF